MQGQQQQSAEKYILNIHNTDATMHLAYKHIYNSMWQKRYKLESQKRANLRFSKTLGLGYVCIHIYNRM